MLLRFISLALLIAVTTFPTPASGGTFDSGKTSDSGISISLPGLTDSVSIYRDSYGTPYIIASNEHDLFYAHGYMQAADRLFQLDGIRRIPQGTTAELIGRDQLSMDMWFRKIGLDRTARKSLEILDPKTRFMLDTFSDGVNAYIENNQNSLPLEFLLLGYKPEPWTSYDSLSVMYLISWWLSVGLYQEMFYDDLVNVFGEDIASALYPGIPSRDEIDKLVEEKRNPEEPREVFKPYKWRVPYPKRVRGTNCWILSGSKTKNKRPILANDPHLELFSPAIWYEIGLSCPEWNVTGVVFPGLPLPQIGTNGKIAWGAASFPSDVQDLYCEKVNPDNKHQYEYNGEWRDYKITKSKVKVKGGKEISFNILESVNGPVVQGSTKYNLALAWTGFEPADDLHSFYKIAKSENVEQFKEALRTFRAIPQHFFAFDLNDNIIHVQPGRQVIRDGFNGDIPQDGGNPERKWSGFIQYDDMPYEKNPKRGFMNNSNNFPPIDRGIDLGITFPLPMRFERVQEFLESRNDFTPEDMAKMQTDTLNPMARKILPLMLSRLEGFDLGDFESYAKLLREWDYDESSDSIAATIYNQWWTELPKHIFNNKMGLYALSYRDYTNQYSMALIDIFENGESSVLWKWLEIGNEDNLNVLCKLAFDLAIKQLTKDYEYDRENWKWGKVHKTHFAHPSKVEFLVDGGSYGVGGSQYSINVTHYFPSMGYESTFGASYRFVASVGENNKIVAKSVLPPGNWAAPLSPHFKDQIKMWVNGEMKDLCVYPDEMSNLPLAVVLKP